MTHILYACLLFGAILLACRRWIGVRGFFASRGVLHAAMIFGSGVVAMYGAAILLYMLYPGYIDHIQPTVAAVSWLAVHGEPIYPDWRTQNVYGMLYGPLVYIVNGVFLLLSPTILMSKLPGVLAFLFTVLILWHILKRTVTANKTVFLLLAVLTLVAASQEFYAYSNRADSFLILIASLMLLPLFMPSYRGIAVLGFLAGVAAGFKLHAVIYAFPTALALFSDQNVRGKYMRMAALGATALLIALCLPFAFGSTAMLDGYRQYLTIAGHHGMAQTDALNSAYLAIILALPMAALFFIRRPLLSRLDMFFLAGLVPVYVLTFLAACKAGSGPHHFLPFLPAYMYGMALLLNAPAQHADDMPRDVLAVFALMFFTTLLGHMAYNGVRQNADLVQKIPAEERKIAELENFITAYPQAPVGVSDETHYADSHYRVLAIFHGAPLPIDAPVWMDLAFGGVDEDNVARFIRNCNVPAWILPQGEAFSMLNWYDRQPLFSDRFRVLFRANYTLVKSGAYYQAWVCTKS